MPENGDPPRRRFLDTLQECRKEGGIPKEQLEPPLCSDPQKAWKETLPRYYWSGFGRSSSLRAVFGLTRHKGELQHFPFHSEEGSD